MAQGLAPVTLTGTLEGDQVLLQMQALQQAQQEALAQQTQQATQAAGQAQQAYGQAAAAPAPAPDALGTLLMTLGGNTASILGGTPSYRENAQQNVQRARSEQLQARAQNLQALRDVYSQRADEAQRAGDLETTEKYRRQFETLSKQWEIVNANAQRASSLEKEEARQKAMDDRAALRDKALFDRQAAHDAAMQRRLIAAQGKGEAKQQAAEFENMLKGLPTLSQFNDDKRTLITSLAPKNLRKTGFEAAINNVQQLRELARQRLRSDRTPGQMLGRLRAHNREVAGLDFKRKAGGAWGSKAKQVPELTFTEEELSQAVLDTFSPGELEEWRKRQGK